MMKWLIAIILLYFACAETPKREKPTRQFNLFSMRFEPTPREEPFLDTRFLDTDVKVVLDTNLRVGNDSLRVFCVYEWENSGLLQTSIWNEKHWEIIKTDTLLYSIVYSIDFKDFNRDKYQDIQIKTSNGGNGWIPQGMELFLYDSSMSCYQKVQHLEDVFTRQFDEERLWQHSQVDSTYFYSYQNTGGCCEQEILIRLGYLDNFEFKEIAYAVWTFDFELDAGAPNDIKFYKKSSKQIFDKIHYTQRKEFKEHRDLYDIIIQYFEKNLAKFIQQKYN